MKRIALILLAAVFAQPLPLLAQNQQINGSLIIEGTVRGLSSFTTLHPSNHRTLVKLNWYQNIPRIRTGGSGIGSYNGLDLQTTRNRSLMRLLHNGNSQDSSHDQINFSTSKYF